MRTRSLPALFGLAAIGVAVLAGCSASGASDTATEPAPPGDVDAQDCVVGTWNLDVSAYAADSESFLVAVGLAVESFVMDGEGTLTFTDDGLVATEIGLATTVAVAGNTISAPSNYTATGDWSRTGDAALLFDNWARVGDQPDIPPEVELPELDFTQLADVTAECSADELFLQGAEAPFGAYWTR